jgi:hypothetical protein
MNDLTLYSALVALGSGAGFIVKTWFGRTDKREADLSQREKDYQARTDKQLADFEKRFAIIERVNVVLVGMVHVIIDEIEPESSALEAITRLLKEAYPVPEHTPAELLNLTARLDAKTKRKRRA